MRKICVICFDTYIDSCDYEKISAFIPETEWMDVTDEEYEVINKATKTRTSSLYNKMILEVINVQPLLPRLKEDLLKIIEKEKKQELEREAKKLEEQRKKKEQQKAALEKKQKKIYEELRAKFGKEEEDDE